MKLSNPTKFRERLVFFSPHLVVFLYVLLAQIEHASIWSALLSAVAFAVVAPTLAMFAYGLFYACLSWVLGLPKPAETAWEFSAHSLAAGVLLATAVWVWWQTSANRTKNAVAQCVDEYRYELETQAPSQVVKSCYQLVSTPAEPVDG